MKIVYFGSGKFGCKCLDAIKKSHHELVQIYTQPARKAGRGKKMKITDVAQWAQQNNADYTECGKVNNPDIIEQLKSYNADLLVVIAFGQKISQDVIDVFPKGAINVHGSVLPKYRGAAPVNWAIINGETETGVSIITLADKMDAGDVLGIGKVKINPLDTADIVHDKLADISPKVLIDVIDQIEKGTAVYETQDHDRATLAPKFTKRDGYIDWSKPAEYIRNMIRGMWPWPGAQAFYAAKSGKTFRATIALAEVAQTPDNSDYKTPGTLDENMNVVCGEGAIKILKLKPAGKNLMDFKSFANGRDAKPGDIFLPIEMIE